MRMLVLVVKRISFRISHLDIDRFFDFGVANGKGGWLDIWMDWLGLGFGRGLWRLG
jgi:hypothetical protein